MPHAVRWLLTFLGLAAAVWAAEPRADEGVILAAQVRTLFQETCVECHGPDLASPDGEFGYVLDFPRMAANPDLIVPGAPDKSEIYLLVLHDEMPGEDSDHGPLSAEQKNLVRRWIELGAPAPAPAVATDGVGGVVTAPAPVSTPRPPPSALKRTLRWLGEFHGPTVHFPVALLVVAALAQLLGASAAMTFCLRVAALTGPVAAGLGWLNAEFASFTSKSAALLAWHRWLGVAAAVLAVLAWWLARRGHPALRAVLTIGAVVVLVAGALGGGLSHGFAHYRW